MLTVYQIHALKVNLARRDAWLAECAFDDASDPSQWGVVTLKERWALRDAKDAAYDRLTALLDSENEDYYVFACAIQYASTIRECADAKRDIDAMFHYDLFTPLEVNGLLYSLSLRIAAIGY